MVNGAFMVLKGHRSIVNQVRFNPHTYMICSSGVEKVIKVSDASSCMWLQFQNICRVFFKSPRGKCIHLCSRIVSDWWNYPADRLNSGV